MRPRKAEVFFSGLSRDRNGSVGTVEKKFDIGRRKIPYAEQMAVGEKRQGRSFDHLKALL